MDKQSNICGIPQHDPMKGTVDVQRTELPYRNPPASEPFQPVTP
jgi:hypothetical protein